MTVDLGGLRRHRCVCSCFVTPAACRSSHTFIHRVSSATSTSNVNPVTLAHSNNCCMVHAHLPVHKNLLQSTILDANVAGNVPGWLANPCNRPVTKRVLKTLHYQNPVAKKITGIYCKQGPYDEDLSEPTHWTCLQNVDSSLAYQKISVNC